MNGNTLKRYFFFFFIAVWDLESFSGHPLNINILLCESDQRPFKISSFLTKQNKKHLICVKFCATIYLQ